MLTLNMFTYIYGSFGGFLVTHGKQSSCLGRKCVYFLCQRAHRAGNSNPLQYSSLGNPMDRGALWATVLRSQRFRHDLATATTANCRF